MSVCEWRSNKLMTAPHYINRRILILKIYMWKILLWMMILFFTLYISVNLFLAWVQITLILFIFLINISDFHTALPFLTNKKFRNSFNILLILDIILKIIIWNLILFTSTLNAAFASILNICGHLMILFKSLIIY